MFIIDLTLMRLKKNDIIFSTLEFKAFNAYYAFLSSLYNFGKLTALFHDLLGKFQSDGFVSTLLRNAVSKGLILNTILYNVFLNTLLNLEKM